MRFLLIAATSFGAAGLELAEAGLLIMVLLGTGYRHASIAGAATAAVIVGVAVTTVGSRFLGEIPVTGLRLYLGTALCLTGLVLWGRLLLRPGAAHAELARETAGTRRLARSQLMAGLAATKIVLIEGSEAAVLTIAIGAPHDQLGAAATGSALAAGTVIVMVWKGQELLNRLNEHLLNRLAGSALVLAGSFWIGDATQNAIPLVVGVIVIGALWARTVPATATS